MTKVNHSQPDVGQGSAHVLVKGISKSFGSKLVLERISLNVKKGEIVTLIGPNGCGKTTFLRILAGLERPSTGEVMVNGRLPSRSASDVGMAFQDLRLLPWLTVFQNIGLPLLLDGKGKEEVGLRVKKIAEGVGVSEFLKEYPSRLSEGEKQRVALARTLVRQSPLLLLDEPFASVDLNSRQAMQVELRQLAKKIGSTMVFVTHSIEEAVFVSDRIVVLSSRPARVIAEVGIDLGEARSNQEVRLSEPFLEYRRALALSLQGEKGGVSL